MPLALYSVGEDVLDVASLVRMLLVTLERPQSDRWIGVVLASQGCLCDTTGTLFGMYLRPLITCVANHFLQTSGQQGRSDVLFVRLSHLGKYVLHIFYIFLDLHVFHIRLTYFLHISYLCSTYSPELKICKPIFPVRRHAMSNGFRPSPTKWVRIWGVSLLEHLPEWSHWWQDRPPPL